MVNWPFLGCLKLMVDKVILKNQVTSNYLRAILSRSSQMTDVWRKGWARSQGGIAFEVRWFPATLLLWSRQGLRSPLSENGHLWIDCDEWTSRRWEYWSPGVSKRPGLRAFGAGPPRVPLGWPVGWMRSGNTRTSIISSRRQLESAHQTRGGVLDVIQNYLVILDAEQTSRFAGQSRDWQKF